MIQFRDQEKCQTASAVKIPNWPYRPFATKPLEEAHLSPIAGSFYRARCHIGSRVIKPELGVDLLYSGYKARLEAFLQVKNQPFS